MENHDVDVVKLLYAEFETCVGPRLPRCRAQNTSRIQRLRNFDFIIMCD